MTDKDAATAHSAEILGLELPALTEAMARMGEKPFRARQIHHWIYGRGATTFEEMTDLSEALRRRLAAEYHLERPRIAREQISADGTRKYLFAPRGGGQVEAVFMPEERRVTFCISPQIGCALDCAFCVTAQMGLTRNLTAGEIVGQALALRDENRQHIAGRPINIVMMGMGEALHNYDASLAAVRLLADPQGVGIPLRRITLSTAGWAAGIRKLAGEKVRPRLAISLNATTAAVRSKLMPVNRRYPIDDLLDACRAIPLGPRERLTFEYVLLHGINDAPEDPVRLAALARRHELKVKVNLIPFNPGGGLPYIEPPAETVKRFRAELIARGIPASVRVNRGRDIDAACGQLALTSGGPSLN